MSKKKKIFIVAYIILICFLLACGIGFSIYLYNQNQTETPGTGEQERPVEEQFLVTFEIEDSQQSYWQIVNNGEFAIAPTTPTKEGYTFKGWAVNGEIVDLSSYPIIQDTTFTAVFASKITTDYVFNGSTLVKYNGTDTNIIIPSSYSINENGEAVDGDDIQITTIGDNAFVNINENFKPASIVVSEGIKTVGRWTFSNLFTLQKISLPSTLTSLGDNCFTSCTSLTQVDFQPASVNLGEGCFYNCSALTTITIPEGITSLNKNTFANCTSLETVILPSSLISLGERSFYNCTSLASVTLPAVESIGLACFWGNSELEEVKILTEKSFYIEEDAFNETKAKVLVWNRLLEEFKTKNPVIADRFEGRYF